VKLPLPGLPTEAVEEFKNHLPELALSFPLKPWYPWYP
jgi:hypothetical protein